jgi:taurine dioxygenase
MCRTRASTASLRTALLFHSDLAFTPAPYLGLSLHAIELPPGGSTTFFVNAVAALAAIAAPERLRLRDLHVSHAFDLRTQKGDTPAFGEPVPAASARATHPLVLKHPNASIEVLYVSQMQSERVVEFELPASDELLAAVFEHLYAPRFIYEHRWQLGDLLVWDNIALQHTRSDPHERPRTLQRVTLAENDALAARTRGSVSY